MAEPKGQDPDPDHRKEPNRRAKRDSGFEGPERRLGDRRKSPRL